MTENERGIITGKLPSNSLIRRFSCARFLKNTVTAIAAQMQNIKIEKITPVQLDEMKKMAVSTT